ncbi:MAG: hypothetical protein A2508_03935 [Candidatus Lambdaproteobacteria bacterium RIFOXYD12_FULL_49_8]|nr:MAG: hypothetical protein A2508_03935 [Candidatus Lambdaproteobacteria bacterium RIFOXYD12_FULL_49_8]
MGLKTLKDFLNEAAVGVQKDMTFGHYLFTSRPQRLDLISNNLLGIAVRVGSKAFVIGDVSNNGFSYAQEIPRQPGLSEARLHKKIDEMAAKTHNRVFPFTLYFEGDARTPELVTHGKLVNHQLFMLLANQEIERECGFVLYKKGIKRGDDPNRFYDKMETLLKRSARLTQRKQNDQASQVATNIAFLNLIGEIGAPPEFYLQLLESYKNRPIYVKYGVYMADETEALRLYSYALHKDAERLVNERDAKAKRILAKQSYFDQLNKQFDTREFLETVWKKGIEYYKLNYIPFPHPTNKEESEEFVKKMKEYTGHLELLADSDYRDNSEPNSFEIFLAESYYWHLIDKDAKYLNKALILSEVQGIMSSCFMEKMAEIGWEDKPR